MADGTVVGLLPQAGDINGLNVGTLAQVGNLTLAQGMTAGYGVNDGNTFNPPYLMAGNSTVPANAYGGNPATQPNRVGLMRNVPGTLPNNQVFELFFLYNPNLISVTFSTDPSMLPPTYYYGTGGTSGTGADGLTYSGSNSSDTSGPTGSVFGNAPDPTVAALTQGQVVSWELLFDRTYDMTYNSNAAASRGVLKDTAALYNLMGTFLSNGAVPISTPIQVVFAQTNLNSSNQGVSGQDTSVSANSGDLWGFTGFITSADIEYGIFRQDMIPSRCTVNLTMQTTYVSAGMGTSATGTTTLPGPDIVTVPNGTAAGRSLAIQAAERAANQQGPPVVAPTPQPSGGL